LHKPRLERKRDPERLLEGLDGTRQYPSVPVSAPTYLELLLEGLDLVQEVCSLVLYFLYTLLKQPRLRTKHNR
jgi:hypothetical protein